MPISTDGFGTIVSGLESGGGGGSVVPDGGDIAGAYEGNLVCDGDVEITANLEVKGNMIVDGVLTNSGGYDVLIHGDLIAGSLDFDRDDTSEPQGSFAVGGDMIFSGMNFRQCAGASSTLIVYGDLIGRDEAEIYGYGDTDGTSGLNITVYGNAVISSINLNGAAGIDTNAGHGGTMWVYGSYSGDGTFTSSGGDATGFDAGNGGNLNVYGNVDFGYGDIYLYGGSGTNGSAGNGGELSVAGSLTVNEIELYGGNCDSTSANHRSGNGGSFYVDGDLTVNDYINVSGGDRYGDLASGNNLSAPYGGYVQVSGNFTVDGDFAGNGGDVYTTGFAPHDAGNGSEISIRGVLTCADDFRAYGGSSSITNAGNGGNLHVEGVAQIDDELEFYGGSSDNGNGGNGGYVDFNGMAHIGYFNLDGGSAVNGNGGNGGTAYFEGLVSFQDSFYLSGGESTSNNETHIAGSGGVLDCRGMNASNVDINLEGGSRFGNTTVSATGNSPANGGTIYCYGDLIASSISAYGGSVFTDYPNAPGGNGGTVTVNGSLFSGNIDLHGGNGIGNAGGQGGTLDCYGRAAIADASVWGGESGNSIVGGDATNNGSGGGMNFRNDVTAGVLYLNDGSGAGAAPLTNAYLGFTGACHVYVIQMTDRAGCVIQPYSTKPVSLRVHGMPFKNTLNSSAGVATGDVSADLSTGTFITGVDGLWYVVTGVAV